MPPKYLQQRAKTRLKPCSERIVAVCDNDTHGGCCKVPPCQLCLELEIGYITSTGKALDINTGWSGSVGGHTFLSYWERNYEGICEYVVEFDGVEVYRSTCEGGASCRNPAGSATVTIGYDTGTLRWEKYEPLELPLINDPNTGCRTFFCGNCRCACKELCMVVTYNNVDLTVCRGILRTSEYSTCPVPEWEGTLACLDGGNADIDGPTYVDAAVRLSRDDYTGGCVLSGVFDGEELSEIAVVDCSNIAGEWTTYSGKTIAVSCSNCGCGTRTGCCPNLPECIYITVDLTATTLPPMPPLCNVFRIYGTIMMCLITDGPAAIWASGLSYLTIDGCGNAGISPFYAIASCGPSGIGVSIGPDESTVVNSIWASLFRGCNGGVLSACDDDVSIAFGGKHVCSNYGALSV